MKVSESIGFKGEGELLQEQIGAKREETENGKFLDLMGQARNETKSVLFIL